jgi:hypothetical protein
MARDELLQESLFREIDEDLRRDRLHQLWKRYGSLVIALIVALLLAVAGYQIWQYFQRQAADAASVRFGAAQRLEATDPAAALAEFEALASTGPEGYALLAKLQAAALMAKQGNRAGAVAAYDRIARDSSDAVYRDLATLLSVFAALQAPIAEVDVPEVQRKLATLAGDASSWRFSARELQALIALASGQKAEAERLLTALIDDPLTPNGVRSRAQQMLTQTGQS